MTLALARRLTVALGAALVIAGCGGPQRQAPVEFGAAPAASVTSTQKGKASYYAHKFHGRTTASGAPYDMHALTAAHKTLPFGTRVRVTNLANGRHVELEITDRGPFVKGRIIDVSWKAAHELDFVQAGVVDVRVDVLGANH
jgi:rare lipoprotein A